MNTVLRGDRYDEESARVAAKAQAKKRHQDWLQAHASGQMFFQLYRCAVCGFESDHDTVIAHMEDVGCKL